MIILTSPLNPKVKEKNTQKTATCATLYTTKPCIPGLWFCFPTGIPTIFLIISVIFLLWILEDCFINILRIIFTHLFDFCLVFCAMLVLLFVCFLPNDSQNKLVFSFGVFRLQSNGNFAKILISINIKLISCFQFFIPIHYSPLNRSDGWNAAFSVTSFWFSLIYKSIQK